MLEGQWSQAAEARAELVEAWERELNALVYELYGLTEEEIGIVKGKTTPDGGNTRQGAVVIVHFWHPWYSALSKVEGWERDLNALVYELYGLTGKEIAIVEGQSE